MQALGEGLEMATRGAGSGRAHEDGNEIGERLTATLKIAGVQQGSNGHIPSCLLYTSPSPRDGLLSRMPSSA